MEEVLIWIAAAVVAVLFAVFAREYVQRVKRFRKMEAEHDTMRLRVKDALSHGTRLAPRPASIRPAPPPPPPSPPPTRHVNDARHPADRSTERRRQETASTRSTDESSWSMLTPAPSYDYDPPPRSHASAHSGSHYGFAGGGGGTFDGGGASSDWPSSSSDSSSSYSCSDSGSSSDSSTSSGSSD